MKRVACVVAAFILAAGVLCGAVLSGGTTSAAGASSAAVSLRIEGRSKNLFYGERNVSFSGELTALDVFESLSEPGVTVEEGKIAAVGGEAGRWLLRVNGVAVTAAPGDCVVKSGDELLLYYATQGMQYPFADLVDMMANGSVYFCDEDGEPITGASVTWDGMSYKTGADGRIIIDSTGVGVPHAVQIEKYDEGGEPTVLRFAPDYTVTAGFSDVQHSNWAAEYIYSVVNAGLFDGTGGGKFSPDMTMTRAMFVTVLGRLGGVTPDHGADTGFADVEYDGWSTGYIAWAAEHEVVNGVDETHFAPGAGVTREQIATILFRYCEKTGYDFGKEPSELGGFADSGDVSGYAESAMEWAVGCGIIGGSDGRLLPGDNATRAQVAAMLTRFSKLIDDYNESVSHADGLEEDTVG